MVSSQLVMTIDLKALYSVCICEDKEKRIEFLLLMSNSRQLVNVPGHHRWTKNDETEASSHTKQRHLSCDHQVDYQLCDQ